MAVQETFELKLLQVFVHVCDLKSFTGASRLLGITPAAVTLQIDRLERTSGPLFERANESRSASRLTDVGSALLDTAHRMLLLNCEALEIVSQAAPSGPLDISISAGAGCVQLAKAMAKFRERHRQVQMHISDSDNATDVDIEIFRTCTTWHLAIEVLQTDDVVWVASDRRRFEADEIALAHGGHLQSAAEAALTSARRPWSLVYDSCHMLDSLRFLEHTGVVMAMPLSSVPAHLVIDRHEELPLLPTSQLVMILKSKHRSVARTFARHVIDAF